jgi:membrane protein
MPALLLGLAAAWMAVSAPPASQSAPRSELYRSRAGQEEDEVGTDARSPTRIPARGWKAILWRVKDEISNDNISVIAAGCAFYGLFALFPAITALVSIYGIVADPAAVESQLQSVQEVVPGAAFEIIANQTHSVASHGATALGWSAAIAIAIALYSASAAVKSIFDALNIAYEETERRSFIHYQLAAIGFTLAGIVFVIVGLAVIVGVPALLRYLPLGAHIEWAVRIASWTILFCLVVLGIGLTYRFGPARAPANWRWLTPGALAAAVLWILASLGFSYYASHFGSYDQTYGALGGVIILLFWLWISNFVVLRGAELNSELELQTSEDTTTGPPQPKGRRDAYVADHVAGDRARAPTPAERRQ